MLPENRIPTHPGEILQEEFLRPLGLNPNEFAKHVGLPVSRILEVVRGMQSVTPEMAWLFAQALGATPEFWVNLQSTYDLARIQRKRHIGRLQVKAT